jgi:hypothetical protein
VCLSDGISQTNQKTFYYLQTIQGGRSAKTKAVTYFFSLFFLSNFVKAFFGRFVTREVQKNEKTFL